MIASIRRAPAWVLVVALVAAMFAFITPPLALAAAPTTTALPNGGAVTMSTTLAYTGTGHGTTAACAINSTMGYPVGDNSATDNVMCGYDDSGYTLAYNVTAGTGPSVFTVRLAPAVSSQTLNATTVANFCTSSTTGGGYTATVVRSGSTQVVCQFSFPAGVSASGTIPFALTASSGNFSEGNVMQPQVWVVGGTATPTANNSVIATDPVTVVNAPMADFQIGQTSTTPSPVYVTSNGQRYLQYDFTIRVSASNTPSTYSNVKGIAGGPGTGTFAADLSGFPTGTIVTSNTLTVSGTTISGTGTTPFSLGAGSSTGSRLGLTVMGDFRALIPMPAESSTPYQWTINLTQADWRSTPTNGIAPYYPTNFGGTRAEPGIDLPRTTTTSQVGGRYVYTGGTNPNNDYWTLTYNSTPSGTLLGKTNVYDSGTGAPTDNVIPFSTASALSPGGVDFWSRLQVNAAGSTSSRLVLCDYWAATTTSSAVGAQRWDATRTPVVRYYQADGSYTSASYHLEFSATSSCGTANSSTGWVSDPSAISGNGPSAVRMVFDQPIDLLGDGTTALVAYLPFETAPAAAYTPATESRWVVANRASIIFNATATTWPTPVLVNMYVSKPTYTVVPTSSIDGSTSAGSTSLTQVSPNTSYYFNANGFNFNTSGITGGAPTTGTFTVRTSLSSCAQNPTVTYSRGTVTDFATRVVREADPGPDGLFCTSDDGPGWILESTWQTSGIVNGSNINNPPIIHTRFDVPAYAPNAANITGVSDWDFTTTGGQYTATGTTNKSAAVARPQTAGQSKTVDVERTMVGNQVTWTSYLFNYTTTALTNAEFIDVLPYDGDSRGSTGSVSNISVKVNGSAVSMQNVYVTTAPPSAISEDTSSRMNEPNSGTWCQASRPSCFTSAYEITAVYVNIPSMPANSLVSVEITADTDGNQDDDVLVNRMGTGGASNLALPIPATTPVSTTLYLSQIAGYVYGDVARNAVRDADTDTAKTDVLVTLYSIWDDGFEQYIDAVEVDENGYYSFGDVPDGNYRVDWTSNLTGEGSIEQGDEITQAYQVTIFDGTPTNRSNVFEIADNDALDVNFGIHLPAPQIEVSKAALGQTGTPADPASWVKVISGQEVTWQYTVTNTGTVIARDIEVTDDQGVQVTCPQPILDPGASMVCTGTATIP